MGTTEIFDYLFICRIYHTRNGYDFPLKAGKVFKLYAENFAGSNKISKSLFCLTKR